MPSILKVVLQQDVPGLGKPGEIVKVRPGFARNHLIPRALAVPATQATLHRIQHEQEVAVARAEKSKKEARELGDKLAALEIQIIGHAGVDQKLFGSVTNKDIEVAVKAKGFVLDRKKIHLSEPIRALGKYAIPVKLHAEVETTLQIEVVTAFAADGAVTQKP